MLQRVMKIKLRSAGRNTGRGRGAARESNVWREVKIDEVGGRQVFNFSEVHTS